MRRLRWRSTGTAAPAASAGTEPSLPSLELVGAAVERSLDAQERRIASLDQRGGVLLGFSGLLVTLVLGVGRTLTWWTLSSGALALAAAVCAAVVIAPRGSRGVRPRLLIERYAAAEPEQARFRVISTLAVLYDSEEDLARRKGRLLRTAVVLLPAAVLVLLVGTTVSSSLLTGLTDTLGRTP